MALIGAEFGESAEDGHDRGAIVHLTGFMETADTAARPSSWELTSCPADNHGNHTIAVIAYYPSKPAYTTWKTTSGFQTWWEGLDPQKQHHGWFLEVFFPSIERVETVFSDGNGSAAEGVARMADGLSGAVKEHGYWGSMRDRLPVAQGDGLVGEPRLRGKAPVHATAGGDGSDGGGRCARIRIPGKQNLTLIRSGQDWSNTTPGERTLYLTTLHPTLTKGMSYLRTHGKEVGCYSCRFMDVLDPVTCQPNQDRTFGLAYFDELGSLEGWSRRHKTHLDIFGGFMRYVKQLGEGEGVGLRLFHEVFVLRPEQQSFEYVGCHGNTGMLASLNHT